MFGFLTVSALANITYQYHNLNRDGGTLFFGTLTATFYLGEIVGAYRTSAIAH